MKNYTAADFGPNGEAVAALIDRARNLTSDQVKSLGEAWNAVPDVFWNATWEPARVAAKAAAWDAGRDTAWDAVLYVAWDVAWGATWIAAQYADWGAGRYATRDAAHAVAVRDLISEEHFNTLYGPWASVMEAGK